MTHAPNDGGLLDLFAAAALEGMCVGLVGNLSHGGRSEISAYAHGDCNAVIVERAYSLAESMLAEKAKRAAAQQANQTSQEVSNDADSTNRN